MRSTDRLIVLAALGVAATSLTLQLIRAPGLFDAPAFAATGPADLGPADALVLTDAKPPKGGQPEFRLRAEEGRMAWGDRSTNRVWSIGAVGVDAVMKAVLGGASYTEKREELDKETKAQDAEFNKRFEELHSKYQGIDPKSPDFPQAQQELEELRSQYMSWRDGSMKIREKLVAEQIEQAYRDLVTAVEIVAEREHIDLVVRFMPTAKPFDADSILGAREQVTTRTFLKYPETLDITTEVMKELGVQE